VHRHAENETGNVLDSARLLIHITLHTYRHCTNLQRKDIAADSRRRIAKTLNPVRLRITPVCELVTHRMSAQQDCRSIPSRQISLRPGTTHFPLAYVLCRPTWAHWQVQELPLSRFVLLGVQTAPPWRAQRPLHCRGGLRRDFAAAATGS